MFPGFIKQLTGLVLVALLIPVNALAREGRGRDVPIAVTAISEKVLQEVIITSELREGSAQDTSIALSTMDSGEITERGVSNARDLNHFAPNVTMTEFQGGKTGIGVNIRGMGQNETIVTFDPAVGVYVDDVLIGKNIGALTDVMDLERIEILRGPQGTLYGRNTMGGTLNFVTKKPGNEFEGYVSGTLGRFDQRDLKGMLNIPLLDESSSIGSLAMRVSGARFNRDGLIDNRQPGAPEGELETRDRSGALVHIAWQPSEVFNALYSYDNTRIDEEPFTPFTTGVDPNTAAGGLLLGGGYVIGFDADRPDFVKVNGDHESKTSVDGHSIHLDFNVSDDITLKSITSHREMVNSSAADSDGSPLSIIQTRDRNEHKQFTQEFRIIGTAMDGALDYVTGLFYMEEEAEILNSVEVFGAAKEEIFGEMENENWALYSQVTWHVTDRLDLTGGLRYTDEDKEMFKWGNGLDFMGIDVSRADAYKGKESYDNVSGLVSVSYNWTDETMSYFKISTGFQSGGFNVRENDRAAFARGFDEEDLIAYELGLKTEFYDRYRLNGAVWYSDYDDKRINNFNPVNLSNFVTNAESVEIYGAELEFLAQLTDVVRVGANYGYTHPDFKKYKAIDPNTMTEIDLSNRTNFPYTPEHTASVFLGTQNDLDFAVLKTRLDVAYKDNYNFLAPQPEPNSQKAYEVVNARVSLDEIQGSDGTEFRVSVWGKNLTDESYSTTGVNILSAFGFAINSYAEPRTYGVDVKVSFR